MNGLEFLKPYFNDHLAFREKRPGVVQILAPLFHEDGDMVDLFVDLPVPGVLGNGERKVRVSDHGLTLMRLSYSYDLDTPNKERIFARMLAENRIEERDGRLSIETDLNGLYPAILQFAQAVASADRHRHYAEHRILERGVAQPQLQVVAAGGARRLFQGRFRQYFRSHR